jgi:hypothetical protein
MGDKSKVGRGSLKIVMVMTSYKTLLLEVLCAGSISLRCASATEGQD